MLNRSINSAELKEFVSSDDFVRIVGKNHAKYKNKWWLVWAQREEEISLISKKSWNWCAFLFSYLWFLYRKMYIEFAIIWALSIIQVTFSIIFFQSDILFYPFWIIIMIISGLYGNTRYLRRCLEHANGANSLLSASVSTVFTGNYADVIQENKKAAFFNFALNILHFTFVIFLFQRIPVSIPIGNLPVLFCIGALTIINTRYNRWHLQRCLKDGDEKEADRLYSDPTLTFSVGIYVPATEESKKGAFLKKVAGINPDGVLAVLSVFASVFLVSTSAGFFIGLSSAGGYSEFEGFILALLTFLVIIADIAVLAYVYFGIIRNKMF